VGFAPRQRLFRSSQPPRTPDDLHGLLRVALPGTLDWLEAERLADLDGVPDPRLTLAKLEPEVTAKVEQIEQQGLAETGARVSAGKPRLEVVASKPDRS
jgi:hypothetical protein